MNEFHYGQIVKSKAGRDKGKIFVIINKIDEYVYLVDGVVRRIDNPKKKKIKHVQPTNIIINSIKDKIEKDNKISNADIRKQLVPYQETLD
jgi:ribosomal protein L14E/L6E/L27E